MSEEYTKDQIRALMAEAKKEVDFYQQLVNIQKESGWKKTWGWLAVLSIFATAFFGGVVAGGPGPVVALISAGLILYYFKIAKDEKDVEEKLLSAKAKVEEYEDKINEMFDE
jgi:Flp pilus assembly protein TadB